MARGTLEGSKVGILALSVKSSVLADVTSAFALGKCKTSYGDIAGWVVLGVICSAYVGLGP